MNAKDILTLVYQAEQSLFTRHDLRSLTTYFSPQFVTHSAAVASPSLEGLQRLVVGAGPDLCHQVVRAFVDGEYVALHGRYVGLRPEVMVGFDVYRVHDGRIVGHWASLVPESAPNRQRRMQLDGDTKVDSEAPTEGNRALVTLFFEDVLMSQRYDHMAHYANGAQFEQHCADVEDGAKAMQDYLMAQAHAGESLEYDRLHRTVAAGQFVLTYAEGWRAGQRVTCCALWQVRGRKIAVVWRAVSPI